MDKLNNYYFEFSDHVLSMKLVPSKYCTYRGKTLDPVREYVWNAERIWVESDNGVYVYYAKNRIANATDEVDEKEFMWIKLSTKDLNG